MGGGISARLLNPSLLNELHGLFHCHSESERFFGCA
jgi:hypothetical protein